MGVISKSIFEDVLSLVLEDRFPDIKQLSDPQNEALFGILNREDVFAILPTGHGKSFIAELRRPKAAKRSPIPILGN